MSHARVSSQRSDNGGELRDDGNGVMEAMSRVFSFMPHVDSTCAWYIFVTNLQRFVTPNFGLYQVMISLDGYGYQLIPNLQKRQMDRLYGD